MQSASASAEEFYFAVLNVSKDTNVVRIRDFNKSVSRYKLTNEKFLANVFLSDVRDLLSAMDVHLMFIKDDLKKSLQQVYSELKAAVDQWPSSVSPDDEISNFMFMLKTASSDLSDFSKVWKEGILHSSEWNTSSAFHYLFDVFDQAIKTKKSVLSVHRSRGRVYWYCDYSCFFVTRVYCFM